MKIRTIFFGSGEFAVPILEALLGADFLDVSAVITQPDKPVGRKQNLTPVPVKAYLEGLSQNVKIYTPSIYRKEQEQILGEERPELIIVADYGQLLPEFTINYPKYKCLNVHGSLLPDLRGAVPIPLAILKGYEKTGVSIPVMTTGLDDGPVVAKVEQEIESEDTTATLKFKLANRGAILLVEVLPGWIDGIVIPTEQDASKATFADKSLIAKEVAQIHADTTVSEAERMIRAFNPWPIVWCDLAVKDKRLRMKIFSAKITDSEVEGSKGEIVKSDKKLFVRLEDGVLELLQIQIEGKKVGGTNEYAYLADIRAVIK
jgi:methionyl-tRNA formyltransferase